MPHPGNRTVDFARVVCPRYEQAVRGIQKKTTQSNFEEGKRPSREVSDMPHYVFRCTVCGHEFEQTLHISDLDTATVRCPQCGSEQTEREVVNFSAVTSKKS
jgi:putative FmdB family regulatory protein